MDESGLVKNCCTGMYRRMVGKSKPPFPLRWTILFLWCT